MTSGRIYAIPPAAEFGSMEVKNNSIVQVRGMHNCNPTDDVKKLVREYASEKNLKLCAGF